MKRTRKDNNRDKKQFFSIKQRWPLGCLLFLGLACHDKLPKPNPDQIRYTQSRIDSARSLLKSGDIILRNGTDEVSRAARSFNRIDTSFSHCGILLIENDTAFVYHALGGSYNPSQQLRRDPIDSFWYSPEIDRFAIYRYDLNPQQYDSLSLLVRQYYKEGLPFDIYFNFLTDDKMYCSEFVFKCLDRSLSGRLSQYIKARQWPFGVSPDDLYLNPEARLIKKVDFK
ncbi:MAG: YiiX/YebB-like N1pC/P60 family cysteine hydrolase [Chitinophagaceae bacterium]